MPTARIVASVTCGGSTASISQTRTEDGAGSVVPDCTPAVVGSLTTRTNDTQGVIACNDTDVRTIYKAVLTWDAANGDHKYRYNCTVSVVEAEDSVSGDGVTPYTVTVSAGVGDNLPAQGSAINVAKQVQSNITVDGDDIDVLCVQMNVRGVVALVADDEAEKIVYSRDAGDLELWTRGVGQAEPISGTPVTKLYAGSGDTSSTNFAPKILVLYDSTDPLGSGQ